jgi:tRNA(Phe) wybutosine-synthesizing methylase Tyw3
MSLARWWFHMKPHIEVKKHYNLLLEILVNARLDMEYLRYVVQRSAHIIDTIEKRLKELEKEMEDTDE